MKTMGQIPEIQKTTRMTTTFPGYNHNEIIADGECWDMQNLSSDAFPAMTVRKARKIQEYEEPLQGIHGRAEALVTIRGGKVYFGNDDTKLRVSEAEYMMPKQIVSNGAYVVIWPDKVYFNTTNYKDRGSIQRLWWAYEHMHGTSGGMEWEEVATACICTGDGEEYDLDAITRGKTAPANPEDGDLWIDTNGKADVLREWHGALSEWQEVPTVYVKISGTNIGKNLKEYDAVTISGLEYTTDSGAPSIGQRVKEQLKTLNGNYIIYDRSDDWIIVIAMLSKECELNIRTLRVDRKAPDLDYICEANNRIWGCKYGEDKGLVPLWNGDGSDVELKLCSANGTPITESDVTKSNTAPASPQNGDLWIDTSTAGADDNFQYTMKKWNSTSSKWETEKSYVRFKEPNIGSGFKENEWLEIMGLYYVPSGIIPNLELTMQVNALNGHHKAIKSDVLGRWFVIEGMLTFTADGGPEGSEIMISLANSKYEFKNELRACALGDFKNWNKYMGLSTDSYAASVGTDGCFTGCIRQAGYPVFFKEDSIHKIYGYNPDSFQVNTIMGSGIQDGSWRSAQVVNETIYYKSRDDVMVFDGNMPRSISEQLGGVHYEAARAGVFNDKYYISMYDEKKNRCEMFCYDTRRGIWFREDSTNALGFGRTRRELFYIDSDNNTLVAVNGNAGGVPEDEDGPIAWEAEFGISGIEYAAGGGYRQDLAGQMYLSRFDLRMYLEPDTKIDLWIEYDSSGYWEHQGQIRGRNRKTFMLPVIPKRCDHLRMKMTGTGNFKLYSIARQMEAGSDG